MMKKTLIHGVVAAAALWPACATAAATGGDAVPRLIEQCEKQPTVGLVNRLMQAMEEDDPTEESLRFAPGTPTDSLLQQVRYWAAEWHYARQHYDLAEQYALCAVPLFAHDSNAKGDCLNLLGIIMVRKGNFSRAATYCTRALEIYMKGGDPDRISSTLNALAGTYMAAGTPRRAEEYILQGLDYADRANNSARKAVLLGMASEVYHKLDHDSLALDYANRAYALDSLHGRTQRLPVRLSQRAVALLGLQRLAEAEEAYRTAIGVLRENGNRHSLAIDLNQLGTLLVEQGRSAEAIELFREAAQIFAGMGDLYNLVNSHRGLYEAYWDIDRDSARVELDRFNTLKDSLYSHATAESLARYTAEFDNLQLRAENRQHRNRFAIDIAAGVLLIVAFALTIRMVSRRHRSHIQELIARIEAIEQSKPKTSAPETSLAADSFLAIVIEEVERGLATGEYGVAQIAQRLNMSEQTFRRRVTEATGKSPKLFISALQMERAAHLLTTNRQMHISEVAVQCGFGDAETFSRAFKRVYGCAPTHYRP